MKIIIPGGAGQVGTILAQAFTKDGHDVVVLSRSRASRPWRTVAWDGESIEEWAAEFEDADVVINLAGQSVNAHWASLPVSGCWNWGRSCCEAKVNWR